MNNYFTSVFYLYISSIDLSYIFLIMCQMNYFWLFPTFCFPSVKANKKNDYCKLLFEIYPPYFAKICQHIHQLLSNRQIYSQNGLFDKAFKLMGILYCITGEKL